MQEKLKKILLGKKLYNDKDGEIFGLSKGFGIIHRTLKFLL